MRAAGAGSLGVGVGRRRPAVAEAVAPGWMRPGSPQSRTGDRDVGNSWSSDSTSPIGRCGRTTVAAASTGVWTDG